MTNRKRAKAKSKTHRATASRLSPATDPTSVEQLLAAAQRALETGDVASAKQTLARGIQLHPRRADLMLALADLAFQTGDRQLAWASYGASLRFAPSARAHVGLSQSYYEQKEFDRAAHHGEQAIALAPDAVEARLRCGMALLASGQVGLASDHLQCATELDRTHFEAHYYYANAAFQAGLAAASVAASLRAAELAPTPQAALDAHTNALFASAFCSDISAECLLLRAQEFAATRLAAVLRTTAPQTYEFTEEPPSRPSRLKIGYVSADFCRHAATLFLMPLLSHHDRSRFYVVAYASVQRPDHVTARCREHCDSWVNALGLSDAELADRIHADGIDVLVDLSMHMAGGRPALFARRPARVQLCWLAYPGTTGVPHMDFRVTDRHLDPPCNPENQARSKSEPVAEQLPAYSECSLILPDTFWCYDPLESDLEVSPLPALDAGYITFGCLNNFAKVNPQVLELWARLLLRLPTAHLQLRAPAGPPRERSLEVLQQMGVSEARITWVERTSRRDYLQLYRRIDVALDPFPYSGHTVSLDALWMGVPVVSRVGETVVGRAPVCFSANMGLEDWVAADAEQYLQIACQQVSDLARLSTLRQTLRSRMQASPLMDGARFTHHFERALELAWQRNTLDELDHVNSRLRGGA